MTPKIQKPHLAYLYSIVTTPGGALPWWQQNLRRPVSRDARGL